MAVAHAISEHAVVRLREAVHGWPAGTVGTVVSDYGEVMLVEVASETGKALEFVRVPVAKLELKR
ncbi:MAG TPA: hypothetical protein VNU28_00475 [Solirubrobacteraceae bacterium]|jgi:hypothetical protein|nr:hypothetical protein [Solirubrobacteraceae bacterium]